VNVIRRLWRGDLSQVRFYLQLPAQVAKDCLLLLRCQERVAMAHESQEELGVPDLVISELAERISRRTHRKVTIYLWPGGNADLSAREVDGEAGDGG